METRVRSALGLGAALVVLTGCEQSPGLTAPALEPFRQDSYWVPGAGDEPFKAYTQNLYLGGDTGPLFTIDFTNIPEVVDAVSVFWADVLLSDIPARIAAVVDDIEERRPHVVGLQEVLQFVELDVSSGGPVPVGFIDFLGLIQAEIGARGLPYAVAAVQVNTTGQLPLAVGAGGITRVLAFTDRVVALRRTDVPVTEIANDTYAAFVPLIPGVLHFTRGWIRVSTEVGGVPYHFVTTHLEVQGAEPIQSLQATELIGTVLAGLEGITVLAGDLNSDAEAAPGDASWTPTYGRLLDAGFIDAWEESGHGSRDRGFTCCQATDLRNGASLLDRRIDFVLVRASTEPRKVNGSMRTDILGDEQADRTQGGLWPADHAGLIAGLRLPAGLYASPAGS